MAFEGLSSKLQSITNKFKGKVRVTEADLKDMLREVKLALLEADVNYKIVKEFIAVIQEKALGQDVLKSLTPGQQVIKIVKDELVELLGGTESKITFLPNAPTVIMLIGLQGSGKTTTAGKLANVLRKQGKKPLLVACDVYRPAAIKQLQVVGKQLNIPVFSDETSKNVVNIAKRSIDEAIKKLNDVIILDTAGRLQIDEDLMQELQNIKQNVRPQEILLVVDSMTGQDAVNVATTFNEKVGIDGIILTKLDGDTRGGAALSVKKVTGKPIKYIATGEKLSDIEPFHPDRMASRILGMGDVLSIIEKAEESDGFVFGTPVYYAHPSGRILSVLDRAFYAGKKAFEFKPGASIISARRGGTVASFDVLNKYFTISQMPIVSSTYWNNVHGNNKEEVVQDLEGMQTMYNLGKNMAWILKCIEIGKQNNINQPVNTTVKTNFIR